MRIGPSLGLALAAAAARYSIDLWPPLSPRFSQMPFGSNEPGAWRGRGQKRRNPNASKQAAAKRARKITKRNRP